MADGTDANRMHQQGVGLEGRCLYHCRCVIELLRVLNVVFGKLKDLLVCQDLLLDHTCECCLIVLDNRGCVPRLVWELDALL